ncbi:MAG: hypothetical protein ABGZ53_31300, partial [Fuerstiella sp.]
WSLPAAQAMLHVRAVHKSPQRECFYTERINREQTQLGLVANVVFEESCSGDDFGLNCTGL